MVGPFVVGGASVFIGVCGVGAVEDPVSVSMVVVTWGAPSLCSGLAAAVAAAVVRIYMARRRA